MIIIDVGANNGSPFLERCHKEPNITVYAFEPTKYLYEKLISQKLNNYIVINKAVSNFNGKAMFNIAGHHDWGCSSLHDFSDNLQETWPGRPDFYFTEKCEIDVIRLDSFIEEFQIKKIDLLHIDAQGSDYEVIESLGDKISIVSKIELEVSNKNPLYKNIKTKNDVINYLENHGFKITGTYSNDMYNNEENLVAEK